MKDPRLCLVLALVQVTSALSMLARGFAPAATRQTLCRMATHAIENPMVDGIEAQAELLVAKAELQAAEAALHAAKAAKEASRTAHVHDTADIGISMPFEVARNIEVEVAQEAGVDVTQAVEAKQHKKVAIEAAEATVARNIEVEVAPETEVDVAHVAEAKQRKRAAIEAVEIQRKRKQQAASLLETRKKAARQAQATDQVIAAGSAETPAMAHVQHAQAQEHAREAAIEAVAAVGNGLGGALFDAALSAAAAAANAVDPKQEIGVVSGMASWATERRAALLKENETTERLERLKWFEAELHTLGLSLEDAPTLDEKQLRSAFRERSRALHPDCQAEEECDTGGSNTNEDDESSIYTLNAAYDAVRKLL